MLSKRLNSLMGLDIILIGFNRYSTSKSASQVRDRHPHRSNKVLQPRYRAPICEATRTYAGLERVIINKACRKHIVQITSWRRFSRSRTHPGVEAPSFNAGSAFILHQHELSTLESVEPRLTGFLLSSSSSRIMTHALQSAFVINFVCYAKATGGERSGGDRLVCL